MAITDPQAVRFANDFARTRADTLAQMYYRIRQMVDEWDATGMSTIIPDDPAEIVEDGSATDGRTPISGRNVHQLVETYCRPLLTDLEANSNLKLNILLSVSVNPTRGL